MDLLSLATTVRSRVEEPVTDLLQILKVLSNPRLPVLLALSKGLIEPTYRLAFLASASNSGVLRCLAARPCDLESLADRLQIGPAEKDRLRAWLDMGVKLGDFGTGEGCYRLNSFTAKFLAQPGNDAVAAALEEVIRFHVPALLHGPNMLRGGERFSLDDQDGAVIARSTRVVESFVEAAVDRNLERSRPVRLLEVGCGSGTYVRHAARLNPRLSALAIDMQKNVADQAASNMAEWGLTDRVETRQGDLRTLDLEPQFDLVTMHNNIYYFPQDDRVETLRRARRLLAPGGKLLLTTSCQGGNTGLEALNLWFHFSDFGGPLPREGELVEQLEAAGFTDVEATQVIPGEQFRACTGTNAQLALD
ncbi:class I SAM-dependent methyltransferase [Streptomyces smyrnaeus]|uniref:SAM-dependent methyltransferase n=1 Tax=Streptomyces smyrnaeus TaxID=1387713 RepID=UPI0033B762F9